MLRHKHTAKTIYSISINYCLELLSLVTQNSLYTELTIYSNTKTQTLPKNKYDFRYF
jgi:hypothetical protein